MTARFHSLRTRLLIPLAGCSLLAAIAVGAVSYVLGDRVVQRSMDSRFHAIRSTLSTATFPLTPTVLKTLAELTETELASYDAQGHRIDTSHPGAPATLIAATASEASPQFDSTVLAGYQTRRFHRRYDENQPAAVAQVLVMFDERDLQQARIAAASLPLATGLSSTLLLSIVALALTERMIHRIAALERSVKRIAAGEFQPRPARTASPQDAHSENARPEDAPPEEERGDFGAGELDGLDELGRLGAAVHKMGGELAILWEAVHRQERQKLIHQIAAGLAHQLRNGLTGARMAVELHARRCPGSSGDGLEVAVRELERTEDYVQRILRIASQPGAAPPGVAQPGAAPPGAAPPGAISREAPSVRDARAAGSVGEATAAVRDSLHVVAEHQRVGLRWRIDEAVRDQRIADAAGFTAALENLVINAIQSGGDTVEISAAWGQNRVQIKVVDNGPGPSESVGDELFEPFVTTKPEGLGLGLALVRRTAEDLGGSVHWFRRDSQTVFVFTVTPLA